MQRRKLIFFLVFGFLTFTSFQYIYAQNTILAKKLDQKYKEQDKDYPMVLYNGQETYTFIIDNSSGQLKVEKQAENEYLVLHNEKGQIFYEPYNQNSTIKNIYIKFRKGNKKLWVTRKYSFKDQFVEIDGLFYHDQRVRFSPLSKGLVLQGEIYIFGVEKIYEDPKYFTNVFFVERFPTIKKKVKFIIPDNVDVELLEKNFDGYNIAKKIHHNLGKKEKIIEYTFKDVPAYYDELHMQGPTYIYPHILVLTKGYKNKNQEKTVFKSTGDLYKWYAYLISQMKEDPSKLKSLVNQLTKGTNTDEEKIKNIFYWVQDNIRYIAYEDGIAGFKPDESQNVLQKRYGDCKGMANLTVQMLKVAGFDAHRTWIGTRHINYDYSTPSLAVDNHMIATLFLHGKKYFLDATESYIPFGEYAERIQGRQVLIENGENYILDRVPAHDASHNKEILIKTINIKEDKLVGKVTNTFQGQSRTAFLQAYNSLRSEHQEDAVKYYIKSDDDNMHVSNIHTSDLTNRESPVTLEYDFVLDNAISKFDDEIYLDFDYDKEFSGMDFEKRITPYEFYHKVDYSVKIVFNIPNGYKVVEYPADIAVRNPDFQVEFKMIQKGNQLIYTKHFVFPHALIKKENLGVWQEFYKKMKYYYTQQITLKKIN